MSVTASAFFSIDFELPCFDLWSVCRAFACGREWSTTSQTWYAKRLMRSRLLTISSTVSSCAGPKCEVARALGDSQPERPKLLILIVLNSRPLAPIPLAPIDKSITFLTFPLASTR
eukprot:176876-Prymnesium_polylepis.1